MSTGNITEHERGTLVNALHVAAREYDEVAANIIATADLTKSHGTRVYHQFKQQSAEARALAEKIEQADEIIVKEAA